MLSKKTIGILIAFLVLAVLSSFLFIKGKPTVSNANPLSLVTREEYGKIKIQTPTQSVLLVQSSSGWEVHEPVKDTADKRLMNQLLSVLEKFSVGSIISENKENYPRFELEEDKARRLTVHKKDKKEPLLDGYFGKQASGYGSAYFRFEGKVPVYLVSDFPGHYFQRAPEDYRNREIFPSAWEKITKVNFTTTKGTFNIKKSSHQWLAEGKEEPISDAWVKQLWPKLRAIRVDRFEDDADVAKEVSFDSSILVAKIDEPDISYQLTIGPKLDKDSKKNDDPHYGRVEGREALLILQAQPINDLIAHIWEASKEPSK